jgi:type I restriction enzyme M protein
MYGQIIICPYATPAPHEILFIDARNLGHLINRRTRELSHDDIQRL